MIIAGLAILCFAAALWAIASVGAGPDSSTEVNQTSHRVEQRLAKDSDVTFDRALSLEAIDDLRTLELINHEHSMDVIALPEEMLKVGERVPASNPSIKLRAEALDASEALFAAGHSAGLGPFQIVSGFRSWEHQSSLYEQTQDKNLIQPPGHSEHHTGLALDIVPTLVFQSGSLSNQLDGGSEDEQWLAENSWRHGLILRYPAGAQHFTGIAFEPWHFRYVGAPHAWYLWNYDLVLEEYLQFLSDSGGYDVNIDGRNYFVRWMQAQDGVVYVPDAKDFSISSDNRGGYIVVAQTEASD
jgi:D-alanyl-D-alanine carboxypeptidase